VSVLALGAVGGVAVVLGANVLRGVFVMYLFYLFDAFDTMTLANIVSNIWIAFMAEPHFLFVWPALTVFVWLPLFALGILMARVLTPLSWVVGRAQWFLKDGKEHPLKAIGYVAAVVVFLGTVAGRAVFKA
jgi:hypothetical protein